MSTGSHLALLSQSLSSPWLPALLLRALALSALSHLCCPLRALVLACLASACLSLVPLPLAGLKTSRAPQGPLWPPFVLYQPHPVCCSSNINEKEKSHLKVLLRLHGDEPSLYSGLLPMGLLLQPLTNKKEENSNKTHSPSGAHSVYSGCLSLWQGLLHDQGSADSPA